MSRENYYKPLPLANTAPLAEQVRDTPLAGQPQPPVAPFPLHRPPLPKPHRSTHPLIVSSPPAPGHSTAEVQLIPPPLALVPNDRFEEALPVEKRDHRWRQHAPLKKGTVEALEDIAKLIRGGLAGAQECMSWHDPMHYDPTEDVSIHLKTAEWGRVQLFVFSALSKTQNLSLLLNFIEAQTKRDWRYFMNEKELSTNNPTIINSITFSLLNTALVYRQGELVKLHNKIHSLAHANLPLPSSNSDKQLEPKTDLDQGDCVEIAREWGIPEPVVESVKEANENFRWEVGEWHRRHNGQ